jgi:hypothetical protein
VPFADLVRMMMDADLDFARQEKTLRQPGHLPAGRGGHE